MSRVFKVCEDGTSICTLRIQAGVGDALVNELLCIEGRLYVVILNEEYAQIELVPISWPVARALAPAAAARLSEKLAEERKNKTVKFKPVTEFT